MLRNRLRIGGACRVRAHGVWVPGTIIHKSAALIRVQVAGLFGKVEVRVYPNQIKEVQ